MRLLISTIKFILFFFYISSSAFANVKSERLPFTISYYKDETNSKKINQIISAQFIPLKNTDILNFGINNSTYWIKLSPKNYIKTKQKLIFLDQSRFAINEMFYQNSTNQIVKINDLNLVAKYTHKSNQGVVFKLPDSLYKNDNLYIKLKAQEAFISKIEISDIGDLFEKLATKDIFFGIYTGIMMVMFFYNLFLYLVVKDRSYLFYIFYILFTWLSQITIQGYKSDVLWQMNSYLDNISVLIFSSLSLVFASLFTISFLNIKHFTPLLNKVISIYTILILLNLFSVSILDKHQVFINLQFLIIVGTILALGSSYYIYNKKHFKPAGYYLLAWSILLLGVILFILKDYGIIPYNNLTSYLMQIASAIEVILLSFALADRISYFKKENELSQKQLLQTSLENEKLIKEQNIVLEQKVKERTEELVETNNSLSTALDNLKSAQSQLVDSEKMVALGQLTAGIAHEINNPINFVTSNVKPLQLDFEDLKEVIHRYSNINLDEDIKAQIQEIENFKKEIDINYINEEVTSLLTGISEGAKRTAEIIRSLRNFSRLDEADMKPVDLNEGLESTIVLVRNNIPYYINVIKELGSLPKVECLPGKINQVFMNLISNGLQAIKSKENHTENETLVVKSWHEEDVVKVSIKDSGTGMTDEVKHRIFEPFFTTKDIGEGTGLGLSIVFSIIETHKGKIEVNSELNVGTEFLITLPVKNSRIHI